MKLGSIIYIGDLLLFIMIIKYSIKPVLVKFEDDAKLGGREERHQAIHLRAGLPSRETSASWRNGPTETL